MTSRKQREILQRHELILDKSRGLFIKHGYHSVTMDMIAREMEYSKGTIYQHFDCKECIIISLCTRFCSLVYQLIKLVGEQEQLPARVQMLLLQEAFILVQETCQDDVQLKNLADSQPFCTKVPSELIDESINIEQQTFEIVVSVVNRAMANQELVLQGEITAEDVAMGCWALAHGIYMLSQPTNCATRFQLTPAKELLRLNSHYYLDGIGWKAVELTDDRQRTMKEFVEQFKIIIDEFYPSMDSSMELAR